MPLLLEGTRILPELTFDFWVAFDPGMANARQPRHKLLLALPRAINRLAAVADACGIGYRHRRDFILHLHADAQYAAGARASRVRHSSGVFLFLGRACAEFDFELSSGTAG